MLRLPPSPLDSFLQTPVPDLAQMGPEDSAWGLAAGFREQDLMAKVESRSAQWLCQMAGLQRNRGRMFAALAYVSQAIEVAHREESNLDLSKGHAIRATIQILQGNYNSARQTMAHVPPLAHGSATERVMAIYEETFAKLLLRSVGSTSFEFNEAKERFQRGFELYGDMDDKLGQIRCLIGLSSVTSGDGYYFRALEYVDTGIKLSSQIDDWRYLNQLLGCAAFAFRDQGYRQNVEDLFQLSIDWSTFIGDRPQKIRSVGGLGEYYRMIFNPPKPDGFDKSLELLRQAISEAEDCGMGPMMLENQMALANLFQKSGDAVSQRKCRELAEKWAKSEAFEGALRVMDWNDLIGNALQVSRERRMATRLEEAIEGSADPFFVFDTREGSDIGRGDLINEFRNSAANSLLGVDPNEVRLLTDLAEVPVFQGLRDPLFGAVNDRITYEDEIRLDVLDGETVWYARRVAPAGGGAVLTFRDITSNRKIEDALREAADRAHEADRAKSEFLANMSHEVRTPINGVLGLAQLLQELELEPTARKYVDGIASSGAILLKVIGDVLDLSKIEARKMPINPRPTRLQPLIEELMNLFSGRASEVAVDLSANIGVDVPDVVIVDDTSLRQVLANLIGNAIKFTREGSVGISVGLDQGRLRFEVTDTGIGVPSDLIEAIFEPFQRAGSEADGIDGTGLGLTISRRLVELMGGQLGVASKQGEGSTFTFTLPFEEGTITPQHESPVLVQAEVRFDGLRVLLVEDNSVNVLVSEGMLAQLGCIVSHAEDGQLAVDQYREMRFDLVLMDVRMPVMDGLAATRAIREIEAGTDRHVPIIALTAGALSQEREACFESGMDDYLVKPFSKSALRETLFRRFGFSSHANPAISKRFGMS